MWLLVVLFQSFYGWVVFHWKRLWCWEGLGGGGEGDNRGWDGWMASVTQWAYIWVNSGLVMDREAWRAAIHVVAKNRTRLSDWIELNWRFLFKHLKKNWSPGMSERNSFPMASVAMVYHPNQDTLKSTSGSKNSGAAGRGQGFAGSLDVSWLTHSLANRMCCQTFTLFSGDLEWN